MNISSRISARFDRFLAHIRPSSAQFVDAYRQVTYLKEHVSELIAAEKRFHLERIFLSGSAAKHTSIARRGEGTFDIDLGVYYRGEGYAKEDLKKLLPYTHQKLRQIYPGKAAQDFHMGKNAVNVTFRESKLKVDVVPIIRDTTIKRRNSGWIPRQDEPRLTSISAHVHFVHKRTALSKQVEGPVTFRQLVRLMKWWNRRLPEHLKQCSYLYELLTAVVFPQGDVTTTWQSSLVRIFTFLCGHAFREPILFTDYYPATSVKRSKDLVVVLDAVNPDNNITRKWNKEIKRDYLNCLSKTSALIKEAQAHERARREEAALSCWCQVFGEEFERVD